MEKKEKESNSDSGKLSDLNKKRKRDKNIKVDGPKGKKNKYKNDSAADNTEDTTDVSKMKPKDRNYEKRVAKNEENVIEEDVKEKKEKIKKRKKYEDDSIDSSFDEEESSISEDDDEDVIVKKEKKENKFVKARRMNSGYVPQNQYGDIINLSEGKKEFDASLYNKKLVSISDKINIMLVKNESSLFDKIDYNPVYNDENLFVKEEDMKASDNTLVEKMCYVHDNSPNAFKKNMIFDYDDLKK